MKIYKLFYLLLLIPFLTACAKSYKMLPGKDDNKKIKEAEIAYIKF